MLGLWYWSYKIQPVNAPSLLLNIVYRVRQYPPLPISRLITRSGSGSVTFGLSGTFVIIYSGSGSLIFLRGLLYTPPPLLTYGQTYIGYRQLWRDTSINKYFWASWFVLRTSCSKCTIVYAWLSISLKNWSLVSQSLMFLCTNISSLWLPVPTDLTRED